jgi:hypothetical protein
VLMPNKKGIADILFAGGVASAAGSSFLAFSVLMMALALNPKVSHDFRIKKAIGMCEETGMINCQEHVKSMSESGLLNYIRDDELPADSLNYGYIYAADGVEVAKIKDLD